MKYMGSKAWMLRNGLGTLLADVVPRSERFVDLFSGSSAVSWHVAQGHRRPVFASDLQEYARALAAAVVERTEKIDPIELERVWLDAARASSMALPDWDAEARMMAADGPLRVLEVRAVASESEIPTVQAFGGHYYSIRQSVALHVMAATLPGGAARDSCLAALVIAASKSAAAPGHTAQPFQPTPTGIHHIAVAWSRDPFDLTAMALRDIGARKAQALGSAVVSGAIDVAKGLTNRDVAFVDPPYSEVQYSRFYHVLERLATGKPEPVSGVGRYPALHTRPQSDFSLKSRSQVAMTQLLETLAGNGTQTVLTFPRWTASNGLSGDWIVECAHRWFQVQSKVVVSPFSTLGGNIRDRAARKKTEELILMLRPRRHSVSQRSKN